MGGAGWFLVRRWKHWGSTDVDDEIWTGTANLSFRRSLGTSILSETVVGAGASLGREAAPKLLGAAGASVLARWAGLSVGQRRLLVACSAGAGMGAVYKVPLGGALITAELLYGSLALPAILPALATSGIATVVAWAYLPTAGFTVLVVVAVGILKPVVPALCLGSGATGGLFTPTLASGAALGAALGSAWSLLVPGQPIGSYALIGATAMSGAAMQTPLAALALVIELTHTADTLIVPMVIATMLATLVTRYFDGYSIYSSRLPAQSPLSH